MKPFQISPFLRKLLAGSLSFFLLSSNFSFLGVTLESGADMAYAFPVPPDYSIPCSSWATLGTACGGGIVYMNTGGIVSIAAPNDESGTLAWWSSGVTNATDMYNGFSNTETLSGVIGTAAKSCWDKVGSGSTMDWYLPSKYELLDMHAFSGVIGGFAYSRYWSSTEFDATDSYDVWFGGGSDGQWTNTYKGSNDQVRCMRKVDFNGGGGGGWWGPNGQCGPANNGVFQPTNFINLTALEKCSSGTLSSQTESGTGWAWSCLGTVSSNCSASKSTATNSINVIKNIQGTGSNTLELYFDEPIRLDGIDNSGATVSDNATGTISTFGTGAPGLYLNTGLSNSGKLVFYVSDLHIGQQYELSLSNIVSLNYGINGNTKQMQNWFKYPFVWGAIGSNATRLVDSYPQNRMANIPIGTTDMKLYFSNELSGATVVSSGSIRLYEGMNEVNYSITSTYETINRPDGGLGGKISVSIPAGSLLSGRGYKIVVSRDVKDKKNAAIDGPNGYGNDQEIFFTTLADYSNLAGMANGSDSSLYVHSANPFPGAFNVPRNSKFQIKFSDPIDSTGSNLDKIKVFAFSGANDYIWTNVTSGFVFSLDPSWRVLSFSGNTSLDANKKYEIRMRGDLRSVFWSYLWGWSGTSTGVVYTDNFTTGTWYDTSAAQVKWSYPGSGAVNQRVDLRSIDIGFDKPLDFNIVSTQTVQLSQNGTAETNLSVSYDIGTKTIHVSTPWTLLPNTSYQVTLIGGTGGIVTTAGNALQGGDYSFSFTTGSSDNMDPFVVNGSEVYPAKIKVRFSRDVIVADATSADYARSVLNPVNYTVKYATGVTLSANADVGAIFWNAPSIDLSGASLSYDTINRELTIMNFSPVLSVSSTATAQNLVGLIASWVTDTQGNLLSSENGWDRFFGPVMAENFLTTVWGAGSNSTNTSTSSWNIRDVSTIFSIYDFTPVSLFPDSNIAGKTSRYHLSFPTSQILWSGSVIELTFPTWFDVSNVFKDTSSPFPNNNITGSGNFSFTVAAVSSNKVVLILTNADSNRRTGQKTYINMDLAGVVNPSAAMAFGTEGYKVDVVTKTIGGSMILETLRSNAIFIQPSGSYSLSVQLKQSDGTTDLTVPNLLVRLNSSRLGTIEGLSDTGGLVTFTGLNGDEYFVGTHPIVLDGTHSQTNYLGNPVPTRVNLTWNQSVHLSLSDTDSDTSLKTLMLNISGFPANEKVVIWASSPSGYFEKRFTASGTGTIVDSMKLKADRWQVGVRPDYGTAAASSLINKVQPAWQSPLPTEVDMSLSSANYTKTIRTADRILAVTLTDGTNPIPGASVWAYSPGGQNMGSNGMTDAEGVVRLKLMDGSYTVWARAEGLPSIPESRVEMNWGDKTLSFVVRKPSLQIGGRILSGDVGIQNAGIYAYQINSVTDTVPKWNYANAITDSNGDYKLFVNENTVWKIGAFVPGIGWLDERIVSVWSSSVTENFLASDIVLYNVSGTVSNLPANTFANVWAESTNVGDYYGNFGTTASDGTYSLQLKSGKSYKIHTFVPGLGEIGTITVSNLVADVPAQNFNAGAGLNTLTLNIQSLSGTNTVVDEFLVDYINNSTKAGGTKKVLSDSGTILNLTPAIYTVRIAMPGSTRFAPQTIDMSTGSRSLDFTMANMPVTLWGIVRDQSGSLVSEAVVEVFNTGGINLSTKTSSGGVYSLKVKGGTAYQIMAKKSGYIADGFTGVTVGSVSLTDLDLTLRNTATASDIITVSGSVYLGSGITDNLAKLNAKVWAQGYNDDGTKNEKWIGSDTDENGNYTLKLKRGMVWKLSSRSDGYEKIESVTIGSGVVSNQWGKDMILDPVSGYIIKSPFSTNMDPDNGWVLNDKKNKIKVILPVWALDGSKESVTVVTKETSNVVDNGNSKPIGGSAKEITAMYTDGTAVTDFNSEVDIELAYSSGELLVALGNTGYTLENMNNLLVSYFDNASDSWRTIATTVLLYKSDGSLLSESDTVNDVDTVTLRAKTNHLTLFTSLVSTVVTKSTASTVSAPSSSPAPSGGSGGGGGGSVSLSTGIAATFNSVSRYLGNTTQSIVLKSGKNINNVLSIKRDGKTIALADLLKSSASTMSSVSKNLVSFAVGDVISTSKEGSLEIALDGYSKMQISPWSSMKIAEVGNGFLSYENLGGNVQYQFDKRDGGKFQYKVKGKTGYATIRGTTLEVSSDTTKDVYKLIEGKIDIYNNFLKKTVTLVSGDSYTAYANGKEDTSKIAALKTATPAKTATTPAIVVQSACGAYKDVESKSEWCPYITKLNEKKVIRTNASYEPNRSISRAELLKMASLSRWVTPIFNKLYTYTDIKAADWWAPYVSTAKRLGYISAVNATFEPNRPITRAEAMKIIMNFSGIKIGFDAKYTYTDIKAADWWAPYVSTAKRLGYISATQTRFRPNDPISRAEVAKILYNIFFK